MSLYGTVISTIFRRSFLEHCPCRNFGTCGEAEQKRHVAGRVMSDIEFGGVAQGLLPAIVLIFLRAHKLLAVLTEAFELRILWSARLNS